MKMNKKRKDAIKAECSEVLEDFRDDLNDMIDELKNDSEKALEEFIYENLKSKVDSMDDLLELAVRGGES